MFTYDVEHYQWHGDVAAVSWHNCPKLADALNTRSKDGWRLHSLMMVANGYLIVFEKEVW